MKLVAIDIGTRNFGVDVYKVGKRRGTHWLYLLDLLVQRDASGHWCRFKMEERLVYDLCARLVDGFRPKLKNATMVGIEVQMTRRMAVVGNVLQAVIQERFPNVCVVKLSPRAVRKHMGAKLKTDLAGKKRTYEQSKGAATRTVKTMLGSKWTSYASAFRKTEVTKSKKKTSKVRIDPGDAMLMALYMRDNLEKLRKARFRAPSSKRVTLTHDERPIRALKLELSEAKRNREEEEEEEEEQPRKRRRVSEENEKPKPKPKPKRKRSDSETEPRKKRKTTAP